MTSLSPSGAPSHCSFCRSIRDSKVQKSWRTTLTFFHASKSADGVAAAESLIFKPSDLLRVFLKHAMKHHTLAHAAQSFQTCDADEKCKSWLMDVPENGHTLFHGFDVLLAVTQFERITSVGSELNKPQHNAHTLTIKTSQIYVSRM